MDKIMSTIIDEAVIQHISALAKRLGTSKKAVLSTFSGICSKSMGLLTLWPWADM
jgi:hypothetical protein